VIAGFSDSLLNSRSKEQKEADRLRQKRRRESVKALGFSKMSRVTPCGRHADVDANIQTPSIEAPDNSQANVSKLETFAPNQGALFSEEIFPLRENLKNHSTPFREVEEKEKTTKKNKSKSAADIQAIEAAKSHIDSTCKLSDLFSPDESKRKEALLEKVKISGASDVTQQCAYVFKLWSALYCPRAELHSKRVTLIKTAIKTHGFDRVVRAVIGCSYSDFHMGLNKEHKKWTHLEHWLSKEDRVEEFASYCARGSNRPHSRLRSADSTSASTLLLQASETALKTF
jgi:hypothetical protein